MKSFKIKTLQRSKLPLVSRCDRHRFLTEITIVISFVLGLILTPDTAVLAQGQLSFSSPQQAVDALVVAVQDDNKDELFSLFGSGAEQLISSGDDVADQRGKAYFLKASHQKITLETVTENQQTLVIGEKEYPFPIPIVRQGERWWFDTASGLEELLDRRIGRNELRTIKVMQAYTDAQREYACCANEDGIPTFAQHLASTAGTKDGLYWQVAEGEPESPFGPLIAKATAKGYHAGEEDGFADPFYGYYYSILTAQGASAGGGAFDYVIDGKMVLGFALIAYPARYGASGIMTFMVNQEGIIYEKDLGEDTAPLASQISLFDPDSSWYAYQEFSENQTN